MHPALRRMLHQRVTAEPMTGRDTYGDPIYGEPGNPLPCRIEPTTKIVVAGDGQQFQAAYLIVVESGISLGDRVTLPGGEVRSARSVFDVPGVFGGIDHLEVYL